MLTKILAYSHSTQWNIDQFLQQELVQTIEPQWPLIVSTRSGLTSTDQVNHDLFVLNRKRGRPSELRNSTTDALVSAVALALGSQGLVTNVAAECSGSLHALYLATVLSQQHQCPCVVFVADNMVTDQFHMWRFASLGALHQSTGRAFDTASQGFRMGQGMAMFVIAAQSVPVQTSVLATIHSYNFFTNPELLANPGAADNIANSLTGIALDKIDLWNAHATGTPVGDRFEYDLFAKLIDHDAPIVGYKSYVGHCVSASGGIELCMSLDDRQQGTLRPNIIQASPLADDSRIVQHSRPFPGRSMIKASFGFGGKTVICQVDFE